MYGIGQKLYVRFIMKKMPKMLKLKMVPQPGGW